jgi:DNA-binding transcriptional MocR family regulator
LKIPCDEQSLIFSARKQGTDVRPLNPYFVGAATMRGLLLGYGAIEEQAISEGLARLRRAMPPQYSAPTTLAPTHNPAS